MFRAHYERSPFGGSLNGLHYEERYRTLFVYLVGCDCPSGPHTCAIADRDYPEARQVVVCNEYHGDLDNYRRVGGGWEHQLAGCPYTPEGKRIDWHYIRGAH